MNCCLMGLRPEVKLHLEKKREKFHAVAKTQGKYYLKSQLANKAKKKGISRGGLKKTRKSRDFRRVNNEIPN